MTEEPVSGWASRSLHIALWRGSIGGIGIWQLVPMVVVWSTVDAPRRWVLVALHGGVLLLAAVGLVRRLPALLFFVALYLAVLADLATTSGPDQPLCFVAAWTANVTVATPMLVLRGRRAFLFPLAAATMLSSGVAVLHPSWGRGLALAILTTSLALATAADLFIRVIGRFVQGADVQARAAEQEHRRRMATQTAGRQLADDARTLHDTVINTLAAVAGGGSAVKDPALVRQVCAREVETIEALLAGRRHRAAGLGSLGSESAALYDTVQVGHSGLTGDELRRHEALLPPQVHDALSAAAGELVRNACKHARSERVQCDIQLHADDFVVTVSDDGVGFVPDPAPGRGLAESVIRRATEAGVRVQITSAPGEGTTATLTYSLGQASHHAQEQDLLVDDEVVDRIRRAACWLWAAVVSGAEAVVEILNRQSTVTGYASVALPAVLCLLVWWRCRGGLSPTTWLVGATAVGVPVTFVLGFLGVEDGHAGVYLWQGIGLTPLLVTLLVIPRTYWPLVAALVVLTVTTVLTTGLLWRAGDPAAPIVLVGLTPQIGQFAAWFVFYIVLGGIGRRYAFDQRRAAVERTDRVTRDAVSAARRRWALAAVDGCMELLTGLARGELAPDDPRVQARCAEEERYLRQLVALDPGLVHLSGWLARALGEARTRSVRLSLRTGEVDSADETSAEQLGRLVLDALATTPRGSEVTVGYFAGGEGPKLLLVGPVDFADLRRLRGRLSSTWDLRHQVLHEQSLIEVVATDGRVAVAEPPERPARPLETLLEALLRGSSPNWPSRVPFESGDLASRERRAGTGQDDRRVPRHRSTAQPSAGVMSPDS